MSNETEFPDHDVVDSHNATLSRILIPGLYRTLNEHQTIQQSLQQSSPILTWPRTTQSPINEFTTEGHFTCAFPVLFPTGAADCLAPRMHSITIGNYFKHLLIYDDGIFARHHRFSYFALNTEMKWTALQTGKIYVSKIWKMLIYQSMNCETWLDEEKGFAIVCYIMLLPYVVHANTDYVKEGS